LRPPPPISTWKESGTIHSPPHLDLFQPYALENAPDGAGIFVLGDSFTQSYWQPLLLTSGASHIGWMHFALCSFNFSDVARFRPTYVILAPTERLMPCPQNNWPHGLAP
jgi:alginate O-acetyltransferase complex protein AlgJ